LKFNANKPTMTYIIVMVLSVLFIYLGNLLATKDNAFFAGNTKSGDFYKAKIISVSDEKITTQTLGEQIVETKSVNITAKLLDGTFKGDEVSFEHIIPDYAGGKVYPYRAGDRIFVFFEFDQSGNEVWQAADFVRDGYITAMVIGFLLLLILFGRTKGLNTVISLIFTTAAVFFVMIPAVIKGWNIYAITFVITAYIVFMTLGVVIGINSKSLSAGIGCLCGVGIAGIITVVMQNLMKLSGLINEESYFVMFINPERPIYLPAVIFAAIVIGALGATMDVSMSIASSLEEIALHKPDITYGELIKSGLNIGRDIMGTMANTLILAYVGSSLNIVLLMLAYNRSITTIINREMIAVEILQAVAGSVGILLTVPATTLITAFFHKKG